MQERQRLNLGFDAVSDPTRRKLIEIILAQPGINISDTCSRFKMTRFSVMRHLNILEAAEILYRERRGTVKHLYVNRKALEQLSSGWLRRAIELEAE